MTIDEIVKRTDDRPLTPEQVSNLNKCLKETEAQFAEEARARRVTNEWLERSYSL